MTSEQQAVMHVMAGVLIRADGNVLLAGRPPGKHLAGFLEFPGGKLETGEAPWDGLARELREELGIEVQSAAPLIQVPWQYDDRHLLLDGWSVQSWAGEPQSLEGQPLYWFEPAAVDPMALAPADRVILESLQSPVTPVA